MNENLISAKEIVQKYGITYQTVNHYTNLGLLIVATKKRNIRMYDAVQVEARSSRIRELVSEGYPLQLIREKLNGSH